MIEALDGLKRISRDPEAPVRLPIVGRYRDKGLTILGKLESGTIHVGMDVTVMPTGETVSYYMFKPNNEDPSYWNSG